MSITRLPHWTIWSRAEGWKIGVNCDTLSFLIRACLKNLNVFAWLTVLMRLHSVIIFG